MTIQEFFKRAQDAASDGVVPPTEDRPFRGIETLVLLAGLVQVTMEQNASAVKGYLDTLVPPEDVPVVIPQDHPAKNFKSSLPIENS